MKDGSAKEIKIFTHSEEKEYYQKKISQLEEKHQSDFIKFEKEINNSKEEDFNKWNDYLDWKANFNLLQNIDKIV